MIATGSGRQFEEQGSTTIKISDQGRLALRLSNSSIGVLYLVLELFFFQYVITVRCRKAQ